MRQSGSSNAAQQGGGKQYRPSSQSRRQQQESSQHGNTSSRTQVGSHQREEHGFKNKFYINLLVLAITQGHRTAPSINNGHYFRDNNRFDGGERKRELLAMQDSPQETSPSQSLTNHLTISQQKRASSRQYTTVPFRHSLPRVEDSGQESHLPPISILFFKKIAQGTKQQG